MKLNNKGIRLLGQYFYQQYRQLLDGSPLSLADYSWKIQPGSPQPSLFLEVGGSQLRLYQKGQPPLSEPWPSDYKKRELTPKEFFAPQLKLLQKACLSQEHQLFYLLSFSCQPQKQGELLLQNFSKNLNVPDLIGKPIASQLQQAIREKGLTPPRKITGLNDSLVPLFATSEPSTLALIAGTGINLSLRTSHKLYNSEAAQLSPPLFHHLDLELQKGHPNAHHPLELMVASEHLYEIYRLEAKELNWPTYSSTLEMIQDDGAPPEAKICIEQLQIRSAQILAALVWGASQASDTRNLAIEGSWIQKNQLVQEHFLQVLNQLDPQLTPHFLTPKDYLGALEQIASYDWL